MKKALIIAGAVSTIAAAVASGAFLLKYGTTILVRSHAYYEILESIRQRREKIRDEAIAERFRRPRGSEPSPLNPAP